MDKEQPIKIQLNSERAIRALIDNDPELQLEIKERIACAIAKGYEKINTEGVNKATNTMANTLAEKIKEDLTYQENPYRTTRYLKSDVQELVKAYTTEVIRDIVWSMVNKREEELRTQIKATVDNMADRIVQKITDKAFEQNVEAEVVRRLDAIRNSI